MRLNLLIELFAVCKLHNAAAVERWMDASHSLVAAVLDRRGATVVCPESFAIDPQRSDDVQHRTFWRCFQVDGTLDFSVIGVIAELSDLLAAAKVSIFVVSNYETDYLLVQTDQLARAIEALRDGGHDVAETH